VRIVERAIHRHRLNIQCRTKRLAAQCHCFASTELIHEQHSIMRASVERVSARSWMEGGQDELCQAVAAQVHQLPPWAHTLVEGRLLTHGVFFFFIFSHFFSYLVLIMEWNVSDDGRE
jgi:hypothetical protein